MPLSTLRVAALTGAALLAVPVAAQSPSATTFVVNSTADDANARDQNPGDGECRDSFTESNPSAEPRCTLRAAVDEANATSGDVVIELPGQLAGGASGSYTLARVAPNMADNTYEDENAFGDLDLGGDFSSLTIRGTGTPGPTVTVAPNDRVFHLLSGEIAIERVTITGGTAQPGDNGVSNPGMGESVDGQPGADGGCVLVASEATATLEQVSVNNCATSSGGNGAAPASSIERTAGGDAGRGGNGGGIANFGDLTVRKSFVAQNGTGDGGSPGNGTAGMGQPVAGGAGGAGGSGGGIYNEGTLTLDQVTVSGNTAGSPSAGAAGTNGGARGTEGEGGAGGGVASVNGGTASITGSIVASNSAGDDTKNDGTGPSATKQPGSDLYNGSVGDTDEGAGLNPFELGSFTDEGFNLIGTNNSVTDVFLDVVSGTAVDQNGNIVGSGQGDASMRIDPVITGANSNETFAVTAYELGANSPAINAGDPSIMDTFDGRGFQRPGTQSGDDRADIGAFEFGSEPIQRAVECSTSSPLAFGDFDADGEGSSMGEFANLNNSGSDRIDLSTCTFAVFNARTERVTYTTPAGGVVDANGTFTYANQGGDQQIPEQTIPNGPGAIVLVDGPVSVGASVQEVLQNLVASVVYVNEDRVIGRRSGGGGSAQAARQAVGYGAAPDFGDALREAAALASEAPVDLAVTVVPNPTAGRALIAFGAEEATDARVVVFDVLGRQIAELVSGPVDRGRHEFAFDGANVPSGVYVVRATVGNETRTARLTVVR